VLKLLAEPTGVVRFELEFFRDARQRHCVRGQVWGWLRLLCQRCLEPVEVQVRAALLLALVQGHEEAAQLPDEYDPLMASDDSIHLLDLVEDEILLALPLIPAHTEGEGCGLHEPVSQRPPVQTRTDHPFQALGQLKKRLH
jgi:uncharacterized protein